MAVCIHAFSNVLHHGQLLYHSDSVEAQIQIGSAIKPLELFQWTTGNRDFGGPLREETIIYFIQQARLADDNCEIINEMASIVDCRLQQGTIKRFQRFVHGRIEEFATTVAESFWDRVLDPNDTVSRWAQIRFWPCVFWLGQDLLKREAFEDELFLSAESSPPGMQACEAPTLDSSHLDNVILIGELLGLLTPVQKRSFILRYQYGLSAPEIALELSCNERTVYKLLVAAVTKMRNAVE